LLGCAAVALIPAMTAGVSTTAYAKDPEAATTSLTEIVVTAQKREQRLQEVPASVSAITSQKLTVSRVQNVTDLDALTPNLTVTFTPAGSSVPTYSMRGEIAAASAPGSDTGVSIYIDGVYLGTGSGSVFDMADIERIEVLKGPQGTLFGRNSTGGAISFTTRGPTGHFDFKQQFTGGNYDQLRSRTRIDTPTWGPFSAALTYTHNERRGDTRNLGAGTTWDYSLVGGPKFVSPTWLGDQNSNAVGASVKFAPAANFNMVYKFDYSDSTFSEVAVGLLSNISPLLATFHLTNPVPTPVSATAPEAVNNWYDTLNEVRAQGHSLTANWHVNEKVNLKNVFGYREGYYSAPGAQLDGAGGLFQGPAPWIGIGTHSAGKDHQISDEVQADFDTHWFHLTTGALFYHYFVKKGQYGTAANSEAFKAQPGFIITVPAAVNLQTDATTNSQAGYGQAEIHVLPVLDVVLGGRYTHDEKHGTDHTTPGGAATARPIAYHDGKFTYTAGVTYKPTKDLLAYVKYSTGYISGGHLVFDFAPETAKSWEGGIKSEWLQHRLVANLAVFSVEYGNLQISTSGAAFGHAEVPQVRINAGDATAKGFELETTFAPARGLTLGADFGYLDFKFTRLDPRYLASLTTNKAMPATLESAASGRPPWTVNLTGQYVTDPLFDDARLNMSLDANYKKEHLGSGNPAIAAATFIPDVWLVNGRIALENLKLGPTRGTVAIWAKNLLDDRSLEYPVGLVPAFGLVAGSYQAARTFGVDLIIEY
jgi:iron complex outermembrane receptor protein